MNRSAVWTASLLLSALANARSEGPASSADARQHLFYLGDERLVVIRFQVLIDGQPAHAAWTDYLERRFQELDANGDDALTGDERRGLPTVSLLSQLGLVTTARGGVLPADASPPDGKISKAEFIGYLRGAGLEPFRVRIDRADANPIRAAAVDRLRVPDDSLRVLFEKLDADGDRHITVDEFQNAQRTLRKLDLDRDESISAGELVQTVNLTGGGTVTMQFEGSSAFRPQFLASSPEQPIWQLAQQLIMARDAHGGGVKDQRLSFAELGLAPEKLDPFDADGDRALDFEETQQFVGAPPADVELIARLGKHDASQLEFAGESRGRSAGELAHLTFDAVQMEFAVGETGYSNHRVHTAALEESIGGAFKMADRDNNGYLEGMEGARLGLDSQLFSLIDADKDGKLFLKEYFEFHWPLAQMQHARVQLDVADRGRNLFRILDTSGDSRLGPREFQAAVARMSNWDLNGDGKLAQAEVLQQFRLVFGRGSLNTLGRAVSASPEVRALGLPSQPAGGPVWFAKMDRNGDGDVSPTEFLGPRNAFLRLDADGNGLLDAREAASAQSTR